MCLTLTGIEPIRLFLKIFLLRDYSKTNTRILRFIHFFKSKQNTALVVLFSFYMARMMENRGIRGANH